MTPKKLPKVVKNIVRIKKLKSYDPFKTDHFAYIQFIFHRLGIFGLFTDVLLFYPFS